VSLDLSYGQFDLPLLVVGNGEVGRVKVIGIGDVGDQRYQLAGVITSVGHLVFNDSYVEARQFGDLHLAGAEFHRRPCFFRGVCLCRARSRAGG
jgi:hypothetical protein